MTLGSLPLTASTAVAISPNLVLSQVYGGGGNSGATYKNDFIEIFNRGTSAVSLAGKSVQYGSTTGNLGGTNVTALPSVTLGAGQYFLVQEAAGAGGTVNLPTPDATGSIAMSATGGKVALVNATTALNCGATGATPTPCSAAQLALVLDLVGYDGATMFEGAAAPTLSNTTSAARANGGCIDTDNNAADFTAGAPAPRNTASPLHNCVAPIVASTSPADGAGSVATNANIAITFSKPVTVTGSWYDISCASGSRTATVSGGPTLFMLDPTADFAADESCAVTVIASAVADQTDATNTMTANYLFSFATIAPATAIHDIQGAGQLSPMTGMLVKNVPGIVTALRTNGFYMEAPSSNWDADPNSSEGIFVFTSSAPAVHVGDAVSVRATVQEFRLGGAATSNLTTTELGSASVTVLSTGNALPPAIVIGTDRTPPTTVIEDDASSGDVETSGVFDPNTDGLDFWETLEGMLVTIPNPAIVGPSNSFNEISVLANDGAGATGRTARGGIKISATDKNPERIIVDDEVLKASGLPFPTQINVGDHFAGSVTGALDYNFGNFMLELTASPTKVAGGLTRETTAAPGFHELSVATFNVENLAPSDPQTKFDTLAALIVNNLRAPDVISIEEVQDNNGVVDDGTVDATQTLTKLRDAIMAAGGPTYQWREIDPVNDQDGGAPGGNIRQVFFFRTDRGIAFIDRPGATSTTANSVVTTATGPQLAYSPGRIDPANQAFNATFPGGPANFSGSRKPIAAEFTYNGHHLFLIANHWNSKGGDDALWGHRQPPVLITEPQRRAQAMVVRDFVNSLLAADASAEIVVLGDLNDFEFSTPLTILKSTGITDLIETLPENERYTYVFEGNSQTLDHILASARLMSEGARTDVVHVNSEFWDQASDHEPQVATFPLVDRTPPDLHAPADVTVRTGAATSCATVVTDALLGIATAVDNLEGVLAVTRTGVPSGNVFPVGTTTVTYMAKDSDGNTATATQNVTVIDDTPPHLAAPANVTRAATGTTTFVSDADLGTPTAGDNCPGLTVTRTGVPAGNAFPHGTATITYTASDASGNTASATQTVTITPTTASVCAMVGSFVSNEGVANSLCTKLDAAAASLARGNVKSHDGQLGAFVHEVDAQRGKALTDAQADVLIALAGAL